jgi:hypothetical protein
MGTTPIHKSEAFAVIDLVVVLAVLAIIFVLLAINPMARVRSMRAHAERVSCIENLEQTGTVYGTWASDHNGRFPASESVAGGGWREFLTNADQGFLCWTNYAIMAKELGQISNEFVRFPKGLVCPSDERKPADTFTNFANANLSYFVGVSACDTQPHSLLGGDRNLGGVTKPDRDYGFSPENSQGNDVAIQTNPDTGSVCWSLKMHSLGKSATAGNVLLADGSAQEVSTLGFRTDWLPVAGQTTNWPVGRVPSSPSIRILFP